MKVVTVLMQVILNRGLSAYKKHLISHKTILLYMKLECIVVAERPVIEKVNAKSFLYETFGLSNFKQCKFWERNETCIECPCYLLHECVMKKIYHELTGE
jgi:hypothetical protein